MAAVVVAVAEEEATDRATGAALTVAMAVAATDMIEALDHVQLAMPAGAEDQMRRFYCAIFGMPEIPKPASLQGRGGFWAMAGDMQVHFGIDADFIPATKAHPAFVITALSTLAERLQDHGHVVRWDTSLPDVKRFFTDDPVGNRVECIARNTAAPVS